MHADPRRKHWPESWKPPKPNAPDAITGEEVGRLLEWMDAMVQWGKNVRDDIIRLESNAGLAPGDPGDPPPTPWRPDEE